MLPFSAPIQVERDPRYDVYSRAPRRSSSRQLAIGGGAFRHQFLSFEPFIALAGREITKKLTLPPLPEGNSEQPRTEADFAPAS